MKQENYNIENEELELLDIEEEVREDDEEQQMFEHYKFDVDKGQSMLRVDKYITNHMEKVSRHRIQLAIEAGYVRANDKVVKANYKVKPGDIITIVMPYQRRVSEIRPENIPLDIKYEDDHLMVINKPAGLVVHPGHGHFSGTLVNALAYHLNIDKGPDNDDVRLGILVHRIDKNTSGLLLVAKNDESQLTFDFILFSSSNSISLFNSNSMPTDFKNSNQENHILCLYLSAPLCYKSKLPLKYPVSPFQPYQR